LERIGSGYYIRGILNKDSIDAGITILDEDEYFADYLGLIGKYLELQVFKKIGLTPEFWI
jgi:hypothetical protein